jgi:hypothetical protein
MELSQSEQQELIVLALLWHLSKLLMGVALLWCVVLCACRNKQRMELSQSEQQELVQEAWGDVPNADRSKLLLQYTHVVTNVR